MKHCFVHGGFKARSCHHVVAIFDIYGKMVSVKIAES